MYFVKLLKDMCFRCQLKIMLNIIVFKAQLKGDE